MDDEPRRKWAVFSGLTRREQHVLTFLIALIAVGLAYEHYKGGWRREPLTLHRAATDSPATAPTPAVASPSYGHDRPTVTTGTIAGPLDLNQASAEQLERLPGIGPDRASAIVRYREVRGPFRRLEDLKQVGGIGEKTLEALRPYLKIPDNPTTPVQPGGWPTSPTKEARTIQPTPRGVLLPDPPRQINLNTATIEDLETLDGIGPVLARRIIAYRQQHGPFRAAVDIQKVPGIGPSVWQKNRDRLTVKPPRQ